MKTVSGSSPTYPTCTVGSGGSASDCSVFFLIKNLFLIFIIFIFRLFYLTTMWNNKV